jgi:hypothetical protein
MTTPGRTLHSCVLITPLLALAAGCAGPLNTEHTVGFGKDVYAPASIGRTSMPSAENAEAAGSIDQLQAPVYVSSGIVRAERARPSVTGIDRSNWSPTLVNVPNDLSAHPPIYTDNVLIPEGTLRSRGRYPTPASSLDTPTSKGNKTQAQEALIAPFAAAADVVLFVPRVIAEAGPMRPTRTGLDPYERAPQQSTIVNAPARLNDSTFTYDTSGAAAYDQPVAPAQPGSDFLVPTDVKPLPALTSPARVNEQLRPARTGVLGPSTGRPTPKPSKTTDQSAAGDKSSDKK